MWGFRVQPARPPRGISGCERRVDASSWARMRWIDKSRRGWGMVTSPDGSDDAGD